MSGGGEAGGGGAGDVGAGLSGRIIDVDEGEGPSGGSGATAISSSRGSLLALALGRPLFRGLFVPGGASRFTVQYEPNPGSVAGRGWRSNNLLSERW